MTFRARLLRARELIQAAVQRRFPDPFLPFIEVTTRLGLEDLALLLPPTEQRLLTHLRSGQSLDALVGTPGFHTVTRRNELVRRLLSRIAAYCGKADHARFVRRYLDRRRPARARTLIPPDRLPRFYFFVPLHFARRHRAWLTITEGQPDPERERRAARIGRQLNS